MVLIYRSALLFMLLACGGCVTDQFGASSDAAPGQASITISRSDDFTDRAAAASVEINGKSVATLAAGRTYTGTVPPGPAVLKVSAWSAPFGLATHRLPAGSTSYRFTVELREILQLRDFAAGRTGRIGYRARRQRRCREQR